MLIEQGDYCNIDLVILFTDSIVTWLIKLSRQLLCHTSTNRLKDSMQARYYYPHIRSHVDNVVCDVYQKYKLSSKRFGLLPEKYVNIKNIRKSTPYSYHIDNDLLHTVPMLPSCKTKNLPVLY